MVSVKIGKYVGYRVYRGSYLLWSPVIQRTVPRAIPVPLIDQPFTKIDVTHRKESGSN